MLERKDLDSNDYPVLSGKIHYEDQEVIGYWQTNGIKPLMAKRQQLDSLLLLLACNLNVSATSSGFHSDTNFVF